MALWVKENEEKSNFKSEMMGSMKKGEENKEMRGKLTSAGGSITRISWIAGTRICSWTSVSASSIHLVARSVTVCAVVDGYKHRKEIRREKIEWWERVFCENTHECRQSHFQHIQCCKHK